MKTAVRERFINGIHMAHNAMASVQEAFSKVGVGVNSVHKPEDETEYEEFIVGESVVGGKFKVGCSLKRRILSNE